MTFTEASACAKERLEEPIVNLERWAKSATEADICAVIVEMDAVLIKAARVRGYLRGYGPHDRAVKESNRLTKLIRKALGFAVAADPWNF